MYTQTLTMRNILLGVTEAFKNQSTGSDNSSAQLGKACIRLISN